MAVLTKPGSAAPRTRPGPRPRPRGRGPARRRLLAGIAFTSPVIAYLAVFQLFPVLYGLYLSFTSYSPLDRGAPRPVGFGNYTGLLHSADFLRSLRVTAQFVAEVLPFAVGLALGLALLANRRIPGIGLFRAGLFLPRIVPLTAVSLIWLWMYSPDGWFNSLAAQIGLSPREWLLDEGSALHAVAFMRVWKALGGNMILFLAGLQAIPPVLYEAAKMDGAGAWARFRHVTLPGLRPVMVYVVTINIVYLAQSFAEIFILTGGGPLGSTTTTNFLIYQEAFQNNQFGSASAMAFVLFAFIFAFSFIAMRGMRRTP
ncbi:sugar ABC transporter permease [Actinomadura viridis]|uniref:Multiple sugar transport system permease protein n=1 Tax=Actinomadura viridis TaxID=58110 RepID=A0A931D9I7_9ACTN|nr:sugar ABC transporter permease [Actinomadura viridis]MBG6086125.1 multiple sugar transport system permease protein [Actinomadura viridis]